MPTEKLYWADPFATTFEAANPRLATFGDRASIVIDRTLFYPEAGGQLADVGTLQFGSKSIAIDDVQIDDAGDIHHLTRDAITTEDLGADVRGSIDRDRRRDHMAQHTAQHALSRALLDVAAADTVSSRLGSRECTIDLALAHVHDRDIARAEDLVNAIVMDDVAVNALFPSASELAAMKLRRAAKVSENVRVIEIAGFDLSPCGGTHCTRSGQMGSVRVVATEKYKGKLRITFHAGRRAIEDARAKESTIATLARDFTCGPLDVPNGVAKLRAELAAQGEQLGLLRGELVEMIAEQLLAAHPIDPSGTTRIAVTRASFDVATLRDLAGRLAARPDVVAFCAAPDRAREGATLLVVQRGVGASFDCAAWWKNVAGAHGGRGGGRPERGEGRFEAAIDLEVLSRAASV